MKKLLLALVAILALGGPALAETAPDFTLRNVDNQEVKLSDLRGKVVLLDFWATWCSPCQVEMPHLERMYKQYADDGFVVLAISVDDARSKSRVKPMVKAKGYTFPVLLDTQTTVVSEWNPQKVLPYSVLIGKDGEVLHRHAGYTPGDEVELEKKIRAALGLAAAPE